MYVEHVPIYVYNIRKQYVHLLQFYNDTRSRYKYMILSLYRGQRVVVDGFRALLCHYVVIIIIFCSNNVESITTRSDLIEDLYHYHAAPTGAYNI